MMRRAADEGRWGEMRLKKKKLQVVDLKPPADAMLLSQDKILGGDHGGLPSNIATASIFAVHSKTRLAELWSLLWH